MYRCNASRLSAKSFVKISVRDSDVVGIAVLSVSIYATPIRGYTATLATRVGVFVLLSVIRSADQCPLHAPVALRLYRQIVAGQEDGEPLPLRRGVGVRPDEMAGR